MSHYAAHVREWTTDQISRAVARHGQAEYLGQLAAATPTDDEHPLAAGLLDLLGNRPALAADLLVGLLDLADRQTVAELVEHYSQPAHAISRTATPAETPGGCGICGARPAQLCHPLSAACHPSRPLAPLDVAVSYDPANLPALLALPALPASVVGTWRDKLSGPHLATFDGADLALLIGDAYETRALITAGAWSLYGEPRTADDPFMDSGDALIVLAITDTVRLTSAPLRAADLLPEQADAPEVAAAVLRAVAQRANVLGKDLRAHLGRRS